MGEAKRIKEQYRANPKICAFCGSPDGTTDDHVPPRCIFTSPRPQLITVPACEACNGGSSVDDELFKCLLSLRVGVDTPAAREFWQKGGLRSIRANAKLHRDILSGPTVRLLRDDGTIEETIAFKWDAESHSRMIEKITRGLYFHHFREILPPDAHVDTHFYDRLNDDLSRIVERMDRHNVGGDDRFVYGFLRAEDMPTYTLWMYQFYKGHWTAATTMPAGFVEPLEEADLAGQDHRTDEDDISVPRRFR